ncbi:Glu/Leu/Phe/Val family dehydrogenase [Alicyclobacillus ferrooxydans]|uniref:Leucine dehydrogenase n=1 Tax=Alicyclobacillus ferrooxydans TaxID=471514 RepID=A0A0P9C9V0_9BACL|nr:Glu/Leu/Phe/Val dehydrogenase [Alicyclobacillus ferrooxydans]KPV42164.1 leucine dehydrogenase [Alicyclobacillus ferrooxydans]
MGIFDEMAKYGHEQVIFCQNRATGLKSIIAIHDTTAGPALGGCRMRPYENEEEMLFDVLRLSRGMTYKCAIADVDNGGGKCVIWGDPATDKTPELFRALGRFVDGLGGRFYTGTDVGTYPNDFVQAKRETPYIVGVPVEYGGSGDSSVPTAHGVMQGIRASAMELWGNTNLKGKIFAVQGLGKVGSKVVKSLADEGAILVVTDVVPSNIEQVIEIAPEAAIVRPETIFEVQCDMFIPCALGAVLNDHTIPKLKSKAIVGSANNQLLDEEKHGRMLKDLGILYAPDYLVNAGGLIQVADELLGANHDRVIAKTTSIYDILLQVYQIAKERDIPTSLAANQLVEDRLKLIAEVKQIRGSVRQGA